MLKVLRSRNREFRKAVFIGVPVVALIVFSALAIIRNISSAVRATDFNPGRIIDDSVFYDKDSMNVQQIQAFLNSQVGQCDTWGSGPSGRGDGRTAAQFAAAQHSSYWHQPPYVCINNYHENPNTGETSFEKGGGAFSGGISAAQIIYNAAQEYGISPKVLLVLLKKESQNVLNDNWPVKGQYKYAMGYGCPDSGPNYTAACVNSKAGFYKQMTLAAWQLKYYKDHYKDGGYSLRIGWNNIQYSPNPACGTKRVNIENVATLSLYIYTPYVPNDAALANFPGTANCGAYGNRNFFMFYNQLFGSTLMVKKPGPKIISNTEVNENLEFSIKTLANKYLDIDRYNSVKLWDKTGLANQKFRFQKTNDGYYIIRSSQNPNKVLDLQGGKTDNETPINLWDYGGGCNQKWTVLKKGEYYQLLSACDSDRAADIYNGQISKNGTNFIVWDKHGGASQQLILEAEHKKVENIQEASSEIQTLGSKNLDNENAKPNNGAKILTWDESGGLNQKFRFQKTNDGYYIIRSSQNPNKVLDLQGGKTDNETPINLWDYGGGCNQKWLLSKNDDQTYTIISACNQQSAIDIYNGQISKNGTRIQLYKYHGSSSQRFKIK